MPQFGDGLQERILYELQFSRIRNLDAFATGHVKDIDNLIDMGANLCEANIQFQLVQFLGDGVQQARLIIGENIDDCGMIRGLVVNDHSRLLAFFLKLGTREFVTPSSARPHQVVGRLFQNKLSGAADLLAAITAAAALEILVSQEERVPNQVIG